jgi:hypothetical protein
MLRFWTRRRSEFPSHIILLCLHIIHLTFGLALLSLVSRYLQVLLYSSRRIPACHSLTIQDMANPPSLSHFVRMSAVDDLSYPLACDDRTRDAVNTIVSGRKSWKTLKGKGEAVWPPYLEAALIEGPPANSDPPTLTCLSPLLSQHSTNTVQRRRVRLVL